MSQENVTRPLDSLTQMVVIVIIIGLTLAFALVFIQMIEDIALMPSIIDEIIQYGAVNENVIIP